MLRHKCLDNACIVRHPADAFTCTAVVIIGDRQQQQLAPQPLPKPRHHLLAGVIQQVDRDAGRDRLGDKSAGYAGNLQSADRRQREAVNQPLGEHRNHERDQRGDHAERYRKDKQPVGRPRLLEQLQKRTKGLNVPGFRIGLGH
ncbi:hypothetical protein D3C73_1281490 [compost metagenome]